jgi:hypothetical protein
METQLNAQKEKERAGATMTPAPPTAAQPRRRHLRPPTAGPVAAQPVAPAPAATVQITQPSPESAHQGRGLRIAGIATASVGVAAVVAGIVFGLHASSLHDEAYKGTYNDSKLQDSKSFEPWNGFPSVSAAPPSSPAACCTTWDFREERARGLRPNRGPGAGGAAVFGRF